MRNLVRAVSRGQNMNMTIAVIGGSVAMATGARMGKGHHLGTSASELFANHFLRRRYPRVNIEYENRAQPGTTSQSRITGSGLRSVEALRPDLVIWDYSSNDLTLFSGRPLEYRAVLERLARDVLGLPSQPAFLLLNLPCLGADQCGAKGGKDRSAWELQDLAMRPVAERYGLPMVSYRDAIWPTFADGPIPQAMRLHGHACASMRLHTCSAYMVASDNRLHLQQSTHQLVADTLAHAWSVAEVRADQDLGAGTAGGGTAGMGSERTESNVLPQIPVFQYAHADGAAAAFVEAAMPCDGGWRTALPSAEASPATRLEPWPTTSVPHSVWSSYMIARSAQALTAVIAHLSDTPCRFRVLRRLGASTIVCVSKRAGNSTLRARFVLAEL